MRVEKRDARREQLLDRPGGRIAGPQRLQQQQGLQRRGGPYCSGRRQPVWQRTLPVAKHRVAEG